MALLAPLDMASFIIVILFAYFWYFDKYIVLSH